MAKASNHYILILCGGSGPRLWPLSRASNPKQFLKIFGSRSLLQETVHRFKKFIPSDNIYIISQEKYLSHLRKDLHKLVPSRNILTEPEKKNTAMAIIYGASIINQNNPQAVITTAPADHFINNVVLFQHDLSRAVSAAVNQSKIVAIGTPATSPNPAYGYILPSQNKFIEKPDQINAAKLIRQGAFWNCGLYTFTFSTLANELQLHQPEYFSLLQKIASHDPIKKIYHLSPSLSFDTAVSEKTKNLFMIRAKFSWSDIGEWKTIFQKLPKVEDEFATINPGTNFVKYNSRRCLVSGPPRKLIGLVGVSNLAVIDTSDSLLICNIDSEDSYHVRDLVSQIVAKPKLAKYFLKSE